MQDTKTSFVEVLVQEKNVAKYLFSSSFQNIYTWNGPKLISDNQKLKNMWFPSNSDTAAFTEREIQGCITNHFALATSFTKWLLSDSVSEWSNSWFPVKSPSCGSF